jgi:hypothetical protein
MRKDEKLKDDNTNKHRGLLTWLQKGKWEIGNHPWEDPSSNTTPPTRKDWEEWKRMETVRKGKKKRKRRGWKEQEEVEDSDSDSDYAPQLIQKKRKRRKKSMMIMKKEKVVKKEKEAKKAADQENLILKFRKTETGYVIYRSPPSSPPSTPPIVLFKMLYDDSEDDIEVVEIK